MRAVAALLSPTPHQRKVYEGVSVLLVCANLYCFACTAAQVGEVQSRVEAVLAVADLPAMKAELAEKENDASQSGVWGDPNQAQALLSRVNTLRCELDTLTRFKTQLEVK